MRIKRNAYIKNSEISHQQGVFLRKKIEMYDHVFKVVMSLFHPLFQNRSDSRSKIELNTPATLPNKMSDKSEV